MKERQPYEPSLLPETSALLKSVEQATGRPIELRALPAIRGHARASYVISDPDRSRHLIVYDPHHSRFLDHLVAHECGHILRFAAASPDEQLVPVSAADWRTIAAHDLLPEIRRLTKLGIAERAVADAVPLWVSGLTAQVTSVPADLRIERWLWDEFPGLRAVQTRSLIDQARDSQQVLQPKVARLTPALVWEASTAMNYALYKSAARYVDQSLLAHAYDRSPAERIGEELLAMAEQAADAGLQGDRFLAERWAERLRIGNWFRWAALSKLPKQARRMWEKEGRGTAP